MLCYIYLMNDVHMNFNCHVLSNRIRLKCDADSITMVDVNCMNGKCDLTRCALSARSE